MSFLIIGLLVLSIGCDIRSSEPHKIQFTTQYQAVLLSNNKLYYGKVEFTDTPYILLKDVFYIVTQPDPATKAAKNVLIRRGTELHGPELMYIRAEHMVMIESVSPNSRIGKLIEEAESKGVGSK
jgi:hypothetical protein